MKQNINILLVGVGGQGTILASKFMSEVVINAEYDVKMSEIKGMSQRGGSVVTQVRIGNNIASPTIDKGEADYIVAFEQMEGFRWADYLKPNGKILINTQVIEPMPVIMCVANYPENIVDYLKSNKIDVQDIDALKIAAECGNAKATNIVMMGVLASIMPIEKSIWENTLDEIIPKKFIEVNKKAFAAGYQLFK